MEQKEGHKEQQKVIAHCAKDIDFKSLHLKQQKHIHAHVEHKEGPIHLENLKYIQIKFLSKHFWEWFCANCLALTSQTALLLVVVVYYSSKTALGRLTRPLEYNALGMP